jgi:hypothetical protein
MPDKQQITRTIQVYLKDNYKFNYSVVINILYLKRKPVLQVIDSATSFNAARFLKDMFAWAA